MFLESISLWLGSRVARSVLKVVIVRIATLRCVDMSQVLTITLSPAQIAVTD